MVCLKGHVGKYLVLHNGTEQTISGNKDILQLVSNAIIHLSSNAIIQLSSNAIIQFSSNAMIQLISNATTVQNAQKQPIAKKTIKSQTYTSSSAAYEIA